MEDVNVIEGNKIIAKFMDGVYCEYPDKIFPGEFGYRFPAEIQNSSWWNEKSLKYHSSWDWIMPVWKKIGGKMYEIRRTVSGEEYQRAAVLTQHVLKAFQKADIDSAFLWIVESVKWYNQLPANQ